MLLHKIRIPDSLALDSDQAPVRIPFAKKRMEPGGVFFAIARRRSLVTLATALDRGRQAVGRRRRFLVIGMFRGKN